MFHEPIRQRLRQLHHGELLFVTEDRNNRWNRLFHSRSDHTDVFDEIERAYNQKRRHSTLG